MYQKDTLKVFFPVWLRNRLIIAGLDTVFSRTKQLCILYSTELQTIFYEYSNKRIRLKTNKFVNRSGGKGCLISKYGNLVKLKEFLTLYLMYENYTVLSINFPPAIFKAMQKMINLIFFRPRRDINSHSENGKKIFYFVFQCCPATL